MADITIDTQVMVVGSNKGNSLPKNAPRGSRRLEDRINDCKAVVSLLLNHDSIKLAVDSKGQIRAEYDKYLATDHGCPAMQVLALYAKYDRIANYDWDNATWKPTRLALQKIRFHSDDHKFVRTAAASESKAVRKNNFPSGSVSW